MKTIRMIAMMMIASGSIQAQSMLGDIHGNVIDDVTKETLPGVVIKAQRGGQTINQAVTDLDGRFAIKAIPSGKYDLIFIYTGKDTLTITGLEVNSDKITWRRDITLSDRNELKGAVVMADRIPLIQPDDPSAQTVGYKQIENNPNLRDMSKLLASLTTDFKTGVDGGDAYVRGARANATVYFIDGVKQRGNASLPGNAIGKVTVYTGGVPAKYGDTTGGVVILETKSYFDLYNERIGR